MRIHLTSSSFSCMANNKKPTCLLYCLPFSRANSTEAFRNHACMHLKWRKVGSRKMIMSAYFCFWLRKPYRCDCLLFLNVSVTLALFHTDALSVRSAVLSFFSPKTHRMFRALSFLMALSTFTLEPHGTAQYFSSVHTELWMATRLNFRTAVKMSQNKCFRDISKFIFMTPVRIIC